LGHLLFGMGLRLVASSLIENEALKFDDEFMIINENLLKLCQSIKKNVESSNHRKKKAKIY